MMTSFSSYLLCSVFLLLAPSPPLPSPPLPHPHPLFSFFVLVTTKLTQTHMPFFKGVVATDLTLPASCVGCDIEKLVFQQLVHQLLGRPIEGKGIIVLISPPDKEEFEVMALDHFEGSPSKHINVAVVFMAEIKHSVALARVCETNYLGFFSDTATSKCFTSSGHLPKSFVFDPSGLEEKWAIDSTPKGPTLKSDSLCLNVINQRNICEGMGSCITEMLDPCVFLMKDHTK